MRSNAANVVLEPILVMYVATCACGCNLLEHDMGIQLSNNAVATVPSAVSSTQTSLTVATGKGALFPILGATDYFYATLMDVNSNFEIVKVTARTDDVMTMVRAQESTLAIPFPANSRFEHRITAATIRAIIDDADDYLLL